MKKPIVALIVMTAVFLTGCLVTSVYPFYTAKDVVSDPLVAGKWSSVKEENEHWSFETNETKTLQLTYIKKDSTNEIAATVFKLGGLEFMDLMGDPTDHDVQPPPIPSHFLFRILTNQPNLIMAALSYDWLEQTVTNNPAAIRHHFVGQGDKRRLVLTADTQELQQFVTKHVATKEAWEEPLELTRENSRARAAAGK